MLDIATRMLAVIAMLVLGACDTANQVQLTSGSAYLSRYSNHKPYVSPRGSIPRTIVPNASKATPRGSLYVTPAKAFTRSIDESVRQAAAVEPILKFPARIGLARIEHGRMVGIPKEELTLWQTLIEKRADLGEFVAINPFVASYTSSALELSEQAHVAHRIRLGAARQHVDAVLIYEIRSGSSNETSILGLADLTIIGGAVLPTRVIDAKARADALLIDVRNGYPYGNTFAEAEIGEGHPSWGSDARQVEVQAAAKFVSVQKLVPEVDKMIEKLISAFLIRATN